MASHNGYDAEGVDKSPDVAPSRGDTLGVVESTVNKAAFKAEESALASEVEEQAARQNGQISQTTQAGNLNAPVGQQDGDEKMSFPEFDAVSGNQPIEAGAAPTPVAVVSPETQEASFSHYYNEIKTAAQGNGVVEYMTNFVNEASERYGITKEAAKALMNEKYNEIMPGSQDHDLFAPNEDTQEANIAWVALAIVIVAFMAYVYFNEFGVGQETTLSPESFESFMQNKQELITAVDTAQSVDNIKTRYTIEYNKNLPLNPVDKAAKAWDWIKKKEKEYIGSETMQKAEDFVMADSELHLSSRRISELRIDLQQTNVEIDEANRIVNLTEAPQFQLVHQPIEIIEEESMIDDKGLFGNVDAGDLAEAKVQLTTMYDQNLDASNLVKVGTESLIQFIDSKLANIAQEAGYKFQINGVDYETWKAELYRNTMTELGQDPNTITDPEGQNTTPIGN